MDWYDAEQERRDAFWQESLSQGEYMSLAVEQWVRARCDENPTQCICRGSGWANSDWDTWEKCPIHYNGQEHPEYASFLEDQESYYKDQILDQLRSFNHRLDVDEATTFSKNEPGYELIPLSVLEAFLTPNAYAEEFTHRVGRGIPL